MLEQPRTKLRQVLDELGLTYRDVEILARKHVAVTARTISEIARGHSKGSYRTQQRILSALNRFEARPREYSFQDVFSSESEPEIGPALPNRSAIVAKGKPLSEVIIEHRR